MAIYTMDLRGLQAIVAGGEAQNASLRGTSAYWGQSMINALDSNFTTQETLVTLASHTGGRAYLDSNDFSQVYKGVQQDTRRTTFWNITAQIRRRMGSTGASL